MAHDQQTYRRGAQAALVGLLVQLALAIGVALAGLWSDSAALHAATWHAFGGLPVWLILVLIYNQQRLERLEALEAEQLARQDQQTAAIFHEHADDLDLARRRLDRLNKWGLNLASLVAALFLLIVGVLLFQKNYNLLQQDKLLAAALRPGAQPIILACIGVSVAFVAFIAARYLAGMTRIREWQLLRGGASYLMGNFVVAMLVAIAAAAMAFGLGATALALLALLVPAFMVLVGLEIAGTFLLSAYRPRRPGEMPRPAFDSRVLGLLTAPESIGKIISETLNYQFGFEISRSWFYQLLGRTITPLIIVGLLMLLGLSTIVIVEPHEQAIITRGGAIAGEPLGPGLHFKRPWPFSRADKYAVGRLHQIWVGSVKTKDVHTAILWTNVHSEGEEQFLMTAAPPTRPTGERGVDTAPPTAGKDSAPDTFLVAAEVVVQYRIADLTQYVKTAQDPQQVLTNIADRLVNNYFATRDMDTLITRGRLKAGEDLEKQIQKNVDDAQLGLQIVFVGVTGIHPPAKSDVAKSFHEQIGALQEKEGMIEDAQKEATLTLALVAGTQDKALAIREAIQELEQLKGQQDAERRQTRGDAAHPAEAGQELAKLVQEKELQIERLLADARGKAAQVIYQARAYRWQRAISERAKAERFDAELAAFNQAPAYYRMKQYLDTLAEGMKDSRKIVLSGQAQMDQPTIRIDLKDASSALDVLTDPSR